MALSVNHITTVEIDGVWRVVNTCQLCKMRGILQTKAIATSDDLDTISGYVADKLPTKHVCVTCFEAPTGFESDNQTHRRLPDAAYAAEAKRV